MAQHHHPRVEPADEFALSEEEAVFLAAAKLWLMRQDRDAPKADDRSAKTDVIRSYAEALQGASRKTDETIDIPDATVPALITRMGQPGWAAALSRGLASGDMARLTADWRLIEAMASTVSERPRAVLMLIELAAFYPWPKGVKFDKRCRRERIGALIEAMDAPVTGVYFDEIDRELRRRARRLAFRKNRPRLVLIGVGGASLGALTGGLAAPFIGASIGASMGLSGAAATNAGLALLGGGSIAAGGFGVAGGTIVISTAFGVGGAGAAGGTTWLRATGTADVLVEAAKLDVLTEYVVLREQSDEAKAKLVARETEARLRAAEAALRDLRRQLADLSEVAAERDALRVEVRELREKVRILNGTVDHQHKLLTEFEPGVVPT